MDEKKNARITILFFCAIILAFTVADLLRKDRLFSEHENRVLASKPEFSVEKLMSGAYTAEYEKYVTDQFVSRDTWIALKTQSDILMQKKDINGVYLGKDDYLIEQHLPEDYSYMDMVKKVQMLKKLAQRYDAKVMLVPTADNILSDKLPQYARYFDQQELLNLAEAELGKQYVDIYSTLEEHREEDIYYRTDHHWTSLGAYYGYYTWAEAANKIPRYYDVNNMQTVTEEFLGTLHSRLNLPMEPDTIQIFPETLERPMKITYDFQTRRDSYYEEKYLETKNKYGYFLDDNHGFLEINTGYRNGKRLFIIKDSYANSMIPLLAPHYETIYVLDLRYYNGGLFDFVDYCKGERDMEMLILYNCVHFLEDFKYY